MDTKNQEFPPSRRPEHYGEESYKNYPEWMHPFILKNKYYNTFIGPWQGVGILVIHDCMLCTPEGEIYIHGVKVDFVAISSLEKRVKELEATLKNYNSMLSHMNEDYNTHDD